MQIMGCQDIQFLDCVQSGPILVPQPTLREERPSRSSRRERVGKGQRSPVCEENRVPRVGGGSFDRCHPVHIKCEV